MCSYLNGLNEVFEICDFIAVSRVNSEDHNVWSGAMDFTKKNINNCYIAHEKIDEDSMSDVWLAHSIYTADEFVMRFLKKPVVEYKGSDIDRFKARIYSFYNIKHPSIMDFLEIDLYNDYIYITNPKFKGMTLSNYLKSNSKFDVQKALLFMVQIANGLEIIHKFGLAHGSLNPESIWIEFVGDIYKTRIYSFAYNELVDYLDENDKSALNTYFSYLSPEQKSAGDHKIDYKSDLYSIGMLILRLVTGEDIAFNGGVKSVLSASELEAIIVKAGVNDNLKSVLFKLLRLSSVSQYQSVSELINDLLLIIKYDLSDESSDAYRKYIPTLNYIETIQDYDWNKDRYSSKFFDKLLPQSKFEELYSPDIQDVIPEEVDSVEISEDILKSIDEERERDRKKLEGYLSGRYDSEREDTIEHLDNSSSKKGKVKIKTSMADRKNILTIVETLFTKSKSGIGNICFIGKQESHSQLKGTIDEINKYLLKNNVIVINLDVLTLNSKQPMVPFYNLISQYVSIFNGFTNDKKSVIRDKINNEPALDKTVLIRFNAGLSDIFEVKESDIPFEITYDDKFYKSLSCFFGVLGSDESPVFFILNNVQSSDDESVKYLSEISNFIRKKPEVFLCFYDKLLMKNRDKFSDFLNFNY